MEMQKTIQERLQSEAASSLRAPPEKTRLSDRNEAIGIQNCSALA
jgi:hypothetical protein